VGGCREACSEGALFDYDAIEARIKERESDALWLPPHSAEHRSIMKEIAKLRIYAEAKQWISSPRLARISTFPKNVDAERNEGRFG
jgi:hypothetical protein